MLTFSYDKVEYNLVKPERCSTKDFQAILVIVNPSINKGSDFNIPGCTCAYLRLKISQWKNVRHAFNPSTKEDKAVGSISWRSVWTTYQNL